MTEVSFQLPLDGYDTLVRILKGYSEAKASDAPVFLSKVATITAMDKSQISRNNGFFVSVGILDREGNGFKLTTAGSRLAQALSWCPAGAPEIQSAWAAIVEKSEFLQRVTAAVRVRGKMDIESFARHIALTSGAPYKPKYLTGARTLISILQEAKRLVEEGEGLTAVESKPGPQDTSIGSPGSGNVETHRVQQSLGELAASAPRIPLLATIQITPTTTDDELAELARKVNLFARLVSEGQLGDQDA
jgi:hypothetical protein